MSSDDMANQIVMRIMSLPPEQQVEALLEVLNMGLPLFPDAKVREMRAEIQAQFDNSLPIVAQTLDLLDGHLALRQIQSEGGAS